ncbi:hypothetical protein [Pectobacterium brasiliense]|uniref:hypothetical protein n=1 Tax=Pectobacterium brasiliense TaxID=180957 RepID=UPI003D9AE003
MHVQKDKPKENENRAIDNLVTQKKSNGKLGVGFVDNRPEATAQRKLQMMRKHRLQAKPVAFEKEALPFISGNIVQRHWDTSGEEPIYRDEKNQVSWHLCSDGELWYELHSKSSPYAGYAGIQNKGSYAKWFMLSAAPFELLKEQASTIEIPEKEKLNQSYHEAYQLYVYLINISTLKWRDIVEKPPFSNFGWKVKAIYEHYNKHVNPLIEKEDGGLDAYYGPFYKRINPFLRAVREKFGDKKYEEIISGNIDGDNGWLVAKLDEISKEKGFNSDMDKDSLKSVLAEIRGAKKEIKKNSEIKPIDNKKTPFVYRGDFSGLVEIMATECGFDKSKLDQDGILDIGKNWTQFQFVSTTMKREISSPADTGTIWSIKLGLRTLATDGGLYTGESEILFSPGTIFHIDKIVTAEKYDNSGPIGDRNTKYIVFARQG